MIRLKALTLLLRNDRAKALLGLNTPVRLLEISTDWSFDGALWAVHFLSAPELDETLVKLQAFGLTLLRNNSYQDMAIAEMGRLFKPCLWLRVVGDGVEFFSVKTEAA